MLGVGMLAARSTRRRALPCSSTVLLCKCLLQDPPVAVCCVKGLWFCSEMQYRGLKKVHLAEIAGDQK